MTTKSMFQTEIEETAKDLAVFSEARALIRARVLEAHDYPVKRLLPDITIWSGTDAVLGSLDLVVHALERMLAELKVERENAPDDPKLRLVGREE